MSACVRGVKVAGAQKADFTRHADHPALFELSRRGFVPAQRDHPWPGLACFPEMDNSLSRGSCAAAGKDHCHVGTSRPARRPSSREASHASTTTQSRSIAFLRCVVLSVAAWVLCSAATEPTRSECECGHLIRVVGEVGITGGCRRRILRSRIRRGCPGGRSREQHLRRPGGRPRRSGQPPPGVCLRAR